MWWYSILFCLMAGGPTSSKCDLTLEQDRPQVSMWPLFQLTCHTSRLILRIYRNLNVRLFVDPAEDLDGSPKLGRWNRLSAWHTGALQLERCVTENWHRESGHSKCDLSQRFGSVTAASRSVRATSKLLLAHSHCFPASWPPCIL